CSSAAEKRDYAALLTSRQPPVFSFDLNRFLLLDSNTRNINVLLPALLLFQPRISAGGEL
ncbi:hypothetical protein, partial [Undibacterium macrobrachii]|uniref:hypothetical protein n=1 Tax=Undibacterium macrobrachii TaxID=1119058 RepID=UPI001E489C2A